MAGFVSASRASMLTRAALVTAAAISAACSADGNPVAPGGVSGAIPGSAATASHRSASEKITLCHRNHSTTGFVVISVAANALDAHLAHGDGRPGEPVADQPGRTFGPGCEVSSPVTVTIGFGGLAGDGARFSTYAESGFTVSVTGPSWFTRDWEVATLFGGPAPFVLFRVPVGSAETSGAIILSGGGAAFRLASLDLYSSITPILYELRGFLNGTPVFTASGTVPNTFGAFRTVSNPYAEILVDSVTVVLINPAMSPCCGNAMGVDNLVLLPPLSVG